MIEILYDSSKKEKLRRLILILPFYLKSLWNQSFNFPNSENISCLAEEIEKIFCLSKLTEEHLIIALVYYEALTQSNKEIGNYNDIYDYFIISLLFSTKYLDDVTFRNKSWSIITGITLKQLNNLEKDALKLLKYSIYMSADRFFEVKKQVLDKIHVCSTSFSPIGSKLKRLLVIDH